MSGDQFPKSVLFVCNMNQIRSPMAEFLTRDTLGPQIFAQSAGIYKGDEDGFMQAIMKERGIDASEHEPETLDELEDRFVDLVVALTSQARDYVADFFKEEAVEIEFWPIENPSIAVGRRDDVLATYRKTRNELEKRIRERFSIGK
ncbi:MAG: low molecular weight phosphatase family protein [Rhizobiaceae bacterium]